MDPFIISTISGLLMSIVEPHPTWYIAGIGALGSVLAGHIEHSGHAVQLVLKNEHQLCAYQQAKLTVLSDDNPLTCHPPACHIDELNHTPIHYLLSCVKAHDITTLLMRLQCYLTEKSIIVLIHNGLGVIEEIKTQWPHLRLIAGVSTVGAYLEKPFVVRAFLEGAFYLGGVHGEFSKDEIKTLCMTFKDAKLPALWEDNIYPMMWEKFALNCSINILTALFRCKNGDLLLDVEPLKKLTAEVAEVVTAYGMNMTASHLFLKVTQLLQRVAGNYSSMYGDVQMNKPTELPYLNEHLIKLAKQKNIATPFNLELLTQFYRKCPRL